MSNKAKTVWQILDGKKTSIAATLNALLMWVAIKGWLDESTLVALGVIATAWFGVGIGDKARKKLQQGSAAGPNLGIGLDPRPRATQSPKYGEKSAIYPNKPENS